MRLLVLSGSMGSGKTTVLGEVSDLLAAADVVHAAVDLDWLGLAHLPDHHLLTLSNLRSVAHNARAAGVDHLVIAGAIESQPMLAGIVEAVGAVEVIVCRLRAPLNVMQARIAQRERGVRSAEYLARVEVLNGILDRTRVEDFAVSTDAVHVTDAARAVLRRAGWLT